MRFLKRIGYVSIGLTILGTVAEHSRGGSGRSPTEEAADAVAIIAQVTGEPASPGGPPNGRPAPRDTLESLGN